MTCVLICETCDARKPFPLQEQEVAEVRAGKHIARHCPSCRATTYWTFAFSERRNGPDRRQAPDRRSGIL